LETFGTRFLLVTDDVVGGGDIGGGSDCGDGGDGAAAA
jgi:hypothetical protein